MSYQIHTFITYSPQHGSKVFCQDCIPSDVDLGADDVQVWQEHSEDWLAPQVCSECGFSIPVYVKQKSLAERAIEHSVSHTAIASLDFDFDAVAELKRLAEGSVLVHLRDGDMLDVWGSGWRVHVTGVPR
jgi:hypothetical protein